MPSRGLEAGGSHCEPLGIAFFISIGGSLTFRIFMSRCTYSEDHSCTGLRQHFHGPSHGSDILIILIFMSPALNKDITMPVYEDIKIRN